MVGAVAPDAPVYVPVGVSYATTHSWQGLPVVVVIGLLVLWLWFAVLRDAVVDLTPWLRRRVPARARLGRRAWLLAPLAVGIGAGNACAVGLSHPRLGIHRARVSPSWSEEYGPIPLYRWLQHVSTVVGSVVVATYCVRRLGRRPVVPRPPRYLDRGSGWLRSPDRAHRRDLVAGPRGGRRCRPGDAPRGRDHVAVRPASRHRNVPAAHETCRASRTTASATRGPNITGSLWSAPLITVRSTRDEAASATLALSAEGTTVS